MRIRRQLFLLLRIIRDFIHGMYAFHFIGPCVTVFGSARLPRQSAEYQMACRVGMALGGRGFTVMTGGGPGLMEAASRGARQAEANRLPAGSGWLRNKTAISTSTARWHSDISLFVRSCCCAIHVHWSCCPGAWEHWTNSLKC